MLPRFAERGRSGHSDRTSQGCVSSDDSKPPAPAQLRVALFGVLQLGVRFGEVEDIGQHVSAEARIGHVVDVALPLGDCRPMALDAPAPRRRRQRSGRPGRAGRCLRAAAGG
ncbi:hypothetical protein GCM10025787_48990 [Saccharopolyspora rosea]